jgi:thiol:disulfide interchange protein DsbD
MTTGLALQNETNPLIATATLTPHKIDLHQNAELKFKIELLKGFHVYEESLQIKILEPEGFLVSKTTIEPVVDFFDKNSKKKRRGIKDTATLITVIEAPLSWNKPHSGVLQAELTYQACTENFCLFPKTILVSLQDSIIGKQPTPLKDYLSSKNSILEILKENFWFGLFVIFLGGILTSFSPCIFPMIPITIAVLGQNAQSKSRLQNFLTSVFYVLGIAMTYSLLGLFVASTGALFGSTLANPYVLSGICAILLLMALGQFGLFEIKTPAFISKVVTSKKTRQNYFGAFISGLISGIVASPCVGPVLVALLSYVITLNNPVLGFVYLFVYALGMGTIFLALGLSNQLLKRLPTSGAWLDLVKNGLGILLLIGFYYYLSLLIPSNWFVLAAGLGIVLFALQFGALLGWNHLSKKERMIKSGMLALLAMGFIVMSDGFIKLSVHTLNQPDVFKQAGSKETVWQELTEESLQKALASGKPTIVDFWANWCEACLKLKSETFVHAEVVKRLRGYNLLQFDATKDSPSLKVFRDRYDISGLPHILFFDSSGKLLEAYLLSEFENSEKFLKRLDAVENKSH